MRLLRLLFSVSVFLFPGWPVNAASPEACDRYAKEALAQLQQAQSRGIPTPFPVWSDSYQHHYDWCLGQTEDALVQGSAVRQRQLDQAQKPADPPAPATATTTSTLVAAPIAKAQPGVALQASSGGGLVSGLQLASGRTQRLQPAAIGAMVYVDRDFKYTRLPQTLTSALSIATANDDKFSAAETPYLRFKLDRPAVVYVAYDRRYRQRPSWLQEYQSTALEVSYRAGGTDIGMQLFSKAFPAGSVVLGGNMAAGERGNFGMYSVFVVASPVMPPSQQTMAPMPGGIQVTSPAPAAAQNVDQQQTFQPVVRQGAAGQVVIPVLMHYVERQVVGVGSQDETDLYVAQQFHASPETRDFYLQLLQKYKALPQARKQLMFDPEVLRLTSSPHNTVTSSDIDRAYRRVTVSAAMSGLNAQENPPPPPNPPGRLVAVDSSGGSMEQQGAAASSTLGIFLKWRWDRPDRPQGFAVYRRMAFATEFQFLTEVPSAALEYRDSPLPQPSAADESYCYEVRAFVRPHVAVSWQANRIESSPSNTACSTYGPNARPLPDTDNDGMADPFDWCPNDGKPSDMQRVYGCPDGDADGLIDTALGADIPIHLRDNCPPDEPGLDGYGPRGPQWDHLRAFDPLPGCPVKYQLRWMGLEIYNDPVDCTDPNAPYRLGCDSEVGLGNEYGQKNEVINSGQPLPPGFEPYLVFGLLNGVSTQGMAQQWTKRWCCGEGVNVGVLSVPSFPPKIVQPSGIEPDNDFRGAEDYDVDVTVSARGMLLFPEKYDSLYSPVDERFGLVLTATLFERDFDMEYTPKKNETDVFGLIEKGAGFMANIVSCSSTGGLGCAKALGEKVAAMLTFGLAGNAAADPVTVKDRDDVSGVASMSFTSQEAAGLTSAQGAIAFSQEIPGDGSYFVSFPKSLVPPPALDSPARSVATMTGRARFCLVRKGLEEAEVLQLCR